MTFDVALFASGVVPINFVPNFTDSLLDPNGDPISSTYQFVDGSINVTAVPEPTTVVLAFLGITTAYLGRAFRARASTPGRP